MQIKIKNMYKDNRTIEEIQKNIIIASRANRGYKKKGGRRIKCP